MPAAFLGIGTNLEAMAELHRSFRLLPSERVLWHGAKERGVARDRLWVWAPILACVFSAVTGTFAALIAITEAGPWQSSALLSAWGVVFAIGSSLAPHYLMDQNLYAVTDRRVLVKNAWTVRSIDRAALSFARITWHRSALGVGHLELVRAVPFGPLSRSQRLMLHDLRAPDAVLSVIRHGEAAPLDEGCDRELCVGSLRNALRSHGRSARFATGIPQRALRQAISIPTRSSSRCILRPSPWPSPRMGIGCG
jgi:hypothetical protein